MKSITAFALVALACAPANAQYGGTGGMGARPQAQSVEAELLEMEQDADKAALKEALLAQARQGIKPVRGTDAERQQQDEEAAALRKFVDMKKEAITARDADLKKIRAAGTRATTTARQPAQFDWQAAIEKSENAQVEAQLLQAKVNLLQPDLAKAVAALAAADVAASKDEAQRPKAEEARKAYEKVKAQFVDYSKRLRLEQQQTGGMSMGMGGGFR